MVAEAIRLDPDFALAYYNRGLLLEGLGKYALAEKDYDKACESDRSRC